MVAIKVDVVTSSRLAVTERGLVDVVAARAEVDAVSSPALGRAGEPEVVPGSGEEATDRRLAVTVWAEAGAVVPAARALVVTLRSPAVTN